MARRRGQDRAKGQPQKVRVHFRANRLEPGRQKGWTQQYHEGRFEREDPATTERLNRKGELSRKRTILVDEQGEPLAATSRQQQQGVVLRVRGPIADVDDGKAVWPCTIRRILRTRLIDERHPIAVGDRVFFTVQADQEGVDREAVVESVAPRRTQLKRRWGEHEHTIAANVDQVIIVASADFPPLKPHLIDRYLVAASIGGIRPVVCINKIDLDDGSAGDVHERYRRLNIDVLMTSAVTGHGIQELASKLKDKVSVFAGQSGTGKSSLLNAIQPGLNLRVGEVCEETLKGRHTTTIAQLMTLDMGGYVVDTPGVRAFEQQCIEPGELEAHFPEFAPHLDRCKFPDCAHTNEDEAGCGVKQAVASGEIHPDRYESYLRILDELIDLDAARKTGAPRPRAR
jgi:ribosome biogenesis GTPase